MSFHPDQLVECIEAACHLHRGNVYRISTVGHVGGIPAVTLVGIDKPSIAFLASRFRPIPDRQHALVKSMMNAALVGARLPQMKAGEARRSPPAAARPDGRGEAGQ